MTLLPIFISMLAFLLSALSFALSLRANAVNQKTELEQLRSELSFKLTIQNLNILKQANKLLDFHTHLLDHARGDLEASNPALTQNILVTLGQPTRIATEMNVLRKRLKALELPSNIFWPSHFKAQFIGLRGEMEEFELIQNLLDQELRELRNLNLERILRITEGLLSRLGVELEDKADKEKL